MKILIFLAVIAVACAQNAHDQFKSVFEKSVDTNGNKRADLSEFEALFETYDLNKDDKVPLAEYINATGAVGNGPAAFFDFLDPNKDSVITKAELPAVLAKFDVGGDGIVTEDEFIKVYEELYKKISAAGGSVA